MICNNQNHFVHFLAPNQIARNRSFLKLTRNVEVRRAYAWTDAISATLFPLLGCVEMQRDAIRRLMSQRCAPAGAIGLPMGILGMMLLRRSTILNPNQWGNPQIWHHLDSTYKFATPCGIVWQIMSHCSHSGIKGHTQRYCHKD
jgi:hypothetical protein